MSGLVGQNENIHQPLLKSKATLQNIPEQLYSLYSKQVISESGSTLDSYDSPLCSYYAGYSIPFSNRNKESFPSIEPSAMTLNSDQTSISSHSTKIQDTYSRINQVLQNQKQFYLPCKQSQNQQQQEQPWNPDQSKDKAAINFSSYMLKLVDNIKKRRVKPRIVANQQSPPSNHDSAKATSVKKKKNQLGYSSNEDSDDDEHSIWDDSKPISLGFDCNSFLNRHNNPLTLFQLYRMRSELYQNTAVERKVIIDEVHTICQHYKQPVSSEDLTWQDEYLQLNYFGQKSQNQKQPEQSKLVNNPMQSLSTPRVSPNTYSFFNPQQQIQPKTTRESTQNCQQEQTVSHNLAQKILLQLQKNEFNNTNINNIVKQEQILTRQCSSKSSKPIAKLSQELYLDEKESQQILNPTKSNQINKMITSLQAISSISSQEAPRHKKTISTNVSNNIAWTAEKEEPLSSSRTLSHLQKLNRCLEQRNSSCELIDKPFSIFEKKPKRISSINNFLQKKSQMTPKKSISSSSYSQTKQYSIRSSSAIPNNQHSQIITTPQKRTEFLNESYTNLNKQQNIASQNTILSDKSNKQFMLSSASQKLRFSPTKSTMNRNQSFKKPISSCVMFSLFADKLLTSER